MLIDTHCHLTDERLLPEVSEVIASAARAGVERLVTVGYDRESSLAGAALADEHAGVWCALGVHPHDASSWTEETGAEFARIAAENAKVVAIGEIGLDYHYDLSPREVQREVFARQLALADECGLPAALDGDNGCSVKFHSASPLLSASRMGMCGRINVFQAVQFNMSVNLRRRQRTVTEHFLYNADVGSAVEHMRRK